MVATDPDATERSSAALERIHRLERQERLRLEQEERHLAQREAVAGGAAAIGGDRLLRAERALRLPMTLLGLAWAVIGIVILTTNASGLAPQALVVTLFILWLVVVVECAARYVLAPNRRAYFAQRHIEPAMVVVPLFQVWRLAGVERVNVLGAEGAERVLAILRHRGLFRVLLAATGLLFLGAWLVMLFEQHAKGSNIHTYFQGLWWAVVTVTTVGYGDFFPVSAGGRAVAVVLMLVGIGLIGVLTATVASFFVAEHADANHQQIKASHEEIGGRIDDIDVRLARMEVALGTAAETTAPATPDLDPPTPAG
jgi:voltage-gated potassium channel